MTSIYFCLNHTERWDVNSGIEYREGPASHFKGGCTVVCLSDLMEMPFIQFTFLSQENKEELNKTIQYFKDCVETCRKYYLTIYSVGELMQARQILLNDIRNLKDKSSDKRK